MVRCSVTTGKDSRNNSLDTCKKRLRYHGEARSHQDGVWVSHSLPGERIIDVSAFNISRSKNQLRDIVYIGYHREPPSNTRAAPDPGPSRPKGVNRDPPSNTPTAPDPGPSRPKGVNQPRSYICTCIPGILPGTGILCLGCLTETLNNKFL